MEDSIPGEEKNVWEIVAIVQLLSHVWLFATQWTAVCQAPLPSTISQSLLKFMSIESVTLSTFLTLSTSGQSIGASASVLPVNIQG